MFVFGNLDWITRDLPFSVWKNQYRQLKKDRKRSTNEVIDEIREKVETSQPALIIDFGQVIGDMLGDLMSSTQPIEIKIYGDNVKILQGLAEKIARITEAVPGTADVFNGITIANYWQYL